MVPNVVVKRQGLPDLFSNIPGLSGLPLPTLKPLPSNLPLPFGPSPSATATSLTTPPSSSLGPSSAPSSVSVSLTLSNLPSSGSSTLAPSSAAPSASLTLSPSPSTDIPVAHTPTPDSSTDTSTSTIFSPDSTLTVEAPASVSASPTPSSTPAPKSFFQNKPAVGVVFGLVGLIVLVLLISLATLAVRRSRRNRLYTDAVSFDPGFTADAYNEGASTEKLRRSDSGSGHGGASGEGALRSPVYAQSATTSSGGAGYAQQGYQREPAYGQAFAEPLYASNSAYPGNTTTTAADAPRPMPAVYASLQRAIVSPGQYAGGSPTAAEFRGAPAPASKRTSYRPAPYASGIAVSPVHFAAPGQAPFSAYPAQGARAPADEGRGGPYDSRV